MAMAYTTAAILALCSLVIPILATDYTIGDSNGWAQGVDYTQWTGGKTFVVGDNLIFNYASPLHTAMEVSSADYSSCAAASPLNADTSSGTTTIALTSPGAHYFICGTPSHCASGMKMAVTVSAATAPTTPTTPSAPSTPTTTSPYSTTPSSIVPPMTTTPRTSTTYPYGSSAPPAGLLGLSSVVIGGAMVLVTVSLLS